QAKPMQRRPRRSLPTATGRATPFTLQVPTGSTVSLSDKHASGYSGEQIEASSRVRTITKLSMPERGRVLAVRSRPSLGGAGGRGPLLRQPAPRLMALGNGVDARLIDSNGSVKIWWLPAGYDRFARFP